MYFYHILWISATKWYNKLPHEMIVISHIVSNFIAVFTNEAVYDLK
jgi:hypothetical protein